MAISAVSFGCSNGTTTTNSNANAAIVVNTNAASNLDVVNNPSAANVAAPATNSAIPGIPGAPANVQVSKNDPTRGNAKPQMVSVPAPDNSEVTNTLGENAVSTRVFKNHPQLAKVEQINDIANKKVTVKVYLRNGKVVEVPEGKIDNPMAAPAANILQAAGTGGQAAAPPGKADESKRDDSKKAPAGAATSNPAAAETKP